MSSCSIKAETSSKSENTSFKRLKANKYQVKRDKGICFKCEEKYHPGHQCKTRRLNVISVLNEEIEDEWGDEEVVNVELAVSSIVGL